jgi:exopolyphosphatase/guanosine-5'-triphosphate,3'-diphosphate pyrophosphatase
MMPTTSDSQPSGGSPIVSEPVAVVELGTTSIRMVVAELHRSGRFRILDSLQQAVSLGRDTFTEGVIEGETVEGCVAALRRFHKVLQEYGITDSRRIRAIATSAVREASNRDAFLDRILVATGVDVQVIDQAEVNRLTYHAVRPILAHQAYFKQADTLVIEVGGGSTEALMFRRGKVGNSHMYRLGSLRLTKMLEDYNEPPDRLLGILRGHVDQTVEQIRASIAPTQTLHMLALGSEPRFACAQIKPDWNRKGVAEMRVADLDRFADYILKLAPKDIVRQYQVTFQEAETLGPALVVYLRLARVLKLKTVLVAEATLRSGALVEMATGNPWTAEFKRQIMNSALSVGRKYQVNLRHARHVAGYSLQIFRLLQADHNLDDRDEMVLTVAALLHETGMFVSAASHHKHSMYLIANSDIFGLGSADLALAALVARYHRRALPKPTHDRYMQLPREDRLRVSKLAAILRVGNALDRERSAHILKLECRVEPGRLLLLADTNKDLAMTQHRLGERSSLFEQIYGLNVILRRRRRTELNHV